jgi:hypothetical protein
VEEVFVNIQHPLNALPEGWPVWTVFITLLVISGIFMSLTKRDLKTEASPWNAISLQFAAFKKGKAATIIKAWKDENKIGEAKDHLFWDSFFILAYSTLLALGCVMAARVLHRPGTSAYNLALILAWLSWLAGLFDFVENYATRKMLDGSSSEGLPWLVTLPATLKWLIGIAALVYTVIGIVPRVKGLFR